MKTALRIGLCLLISGCLLSFAGCKKKETPATAIAPPRTIETKPAAEQPKAAAPAAEVKPEAAKAAAEQIKTAVSDTVPIADVQAEAGKMGLEQLKGKAMEYKDLIASKKALLEPLVAKLKAIPLTEQMGTEAKGLQTDIATLNKSVSALTERFQVYYNKYKEMGGDVSKLGI
jgi:hypothetical protein